MVTVCLIIVFIIYFQYSVKFLKQHRTPSIINKNTNKYNLNNKSIQQKLQVTNENKAIQNNSINLGNKSTLVVMTITTTSTTVATKRKLKFYEKILKKLSLAGYEDRDTCPMIPPNLGKLYNSNQLNKIQ